MQRQRQRQRRTRKKQNPKQSNNWIVAIPSYKRPATLRDKTLSVLSTYAIPPHKIHVFVASQAEYDEYTSTLLPNTYGFLHIAKPGMAAVRNFITGFFPEDQAILNMDDDIRGFIEYDPANTNKRHERLLRSLSDVIDRGFEEARKTGYRLFGFYPVANGYFMRPGAAPTSDLRYIIGSVWGILNPGLGALRVTIDDKEDYLRTVIMYLLDGGVLRFNTISPQSAYYTEPGGMQEERTLQRIEASANAMVKAFPDLVKINRTKKSGKPEVRLRDTRPVPDRVFGLKALKAYTLPHV